MARFKNLNTKLKSIINFIPFIINSLSTSGTEITFLMIILNKFFFCSLSVAAQEKVKV